MHYSLCYGADVVVDDDVVDIVRDPYEEATAIATTRAKPMARAMKRYDGDDDGMIAHDDDDAVDDDAVTLFVFMVSVMMHGRSCDDDDDAAAERRARH